MAASICSFAASAARPQLREAFGPVIDRLAANGIDLTQHAGRGGADRALPHGRHPRGRQRMRTELPGLFAAGEAVGGANGANRLSGNAITEALVFGAAPDDAAASAAKRRCAIGRRRPRARARSDPAKARPKRPINTAADDRELAGGDVRRRRPAAHRRGARTRACHASPS